jgi:prevent-host-death family protein
MPDTQLAVNVAEAKAHFSELLTRAQRGDEVVISRAGRPIARLAPLSPPQEREFGQFPGMRIDDDFDAPMSEEELALWEA